jgi:hypothetical protein
MNVPVIPSVELVPPMEYSAPPQSPTEEFKEEPAVDHLVSDDEYASLLQKEREARERNEAGFRKIEFLTQKKQRLVNQIARDKAACQTLQDRICKEQESKRRRRAHH